VASPVPVVFLVDDDASVLKALARLLGTEGVETRTFQSSCAFLDQHDPDLPGCIVLDVAMPGLSGLDLQPLLARAGHVQPIIFISGHSDIRTSVSAMKHGAMDFLTKPFDDRELLSAVADAIERDRAARHDRAALEKIENRLSSLTPRERAVFAQVVVGKLNKQIAASLGIVEKTVKVHRARMMRKMGVRSLAELVQLSDRVGLQPGRQRQAPQRTAVG